MEIRPIFVPNLKMFGMIVKIVELPSSIRVFIDWMKQILPLERRRINDQSIGLKNLSVALHLATASARDLTPNL